MRKRELTIGDTEERFMDSVSFCPTTGCWLWTGKFHYMSKYGQFHFGGWRHRAHRFSWELFRGGIPGNLFVLHKCDTPLCVNPEHLFLGTARDNTHDAIRKGRFVNGMIGRKHSESSRRLMSINHRGKDTPETRLKKSATKTGSMNPNARLTEDIVRVLRYFRDGGVMRKDVAEIFPYNLCVLSQVLNAKLWKSVERHPTTLDQDTYHSLRKTAEEKGITVPDYPS
jgi:hypothetical protein